MNQYTPIFTKGPSGRVQVEAMWIGQISIFHVKLKALIGETTITHSWYYRSSNIAYLTFDVSGTNGDCNMTIAITGETKLPALNNTKLANELELEVLDAVDAHYLIVSFAEILGASIFFGPKTQIL